MTGMRSAFAQVVQEVAETVQAVVMVGDISHGILQPFAAANPSRLHTSASVSRAW